MGVAPHHHPHISGANAYGLPNVILWEDLKKLLLEGGDTIGLGLIGVTLSFQRFMPAMRVIERKPKR